MKGKGIRSNLLLPILLLVVIFAFSSQTFALSNSNTLPGTQPGSRSVERVEERLENRQEKKEDLVENRCERLTARIQNRLQNFETNRERHQERYQFLKNKLINIADRLDAKGYDTAQLREHYQEFDGMVQVYAQQYTEFIEALRVTTNFSCGESEGDFAEALQEARAKLQIARQTRAQIREYYRNVIREDVKALRNQEL